MIAEGSTSFLQARSQLNQRFLTSRCHLPFLRIESDHSEIHPIFFSSSNMFFARLKITVKVLNDV